MELHSGGNLEGLFPFFITLALETPWRLLLLQNKMDGQEMESFAATGSCR